MFSGRRRRGFPFAGDAVGPHLEDTLMVPSLREDTLYLEVLAVVSKAACYGDICPCSAQV